MTLFTRAGESFTTPASNVRRRQVALPVYVGSNGYIQNAEFVQQPVPALEKGQITGPHAVVCTARSRPRPPARYVPSSEALEPTSWWPRMAPPIRPQAWRS